MAWPVSALAWLAVLMLLHVLPYLWATVTLDTARDLHAARQIVGSEWLGRGPVFNGLFHLGPIWFYLLAPVWAITQSAAWTLAWVGLLASLKFPMAYRLGQAIRGHDLGLLLALLLALPGWSAMGALFPTHTVMVECAVLAQLLLIWRLAHGARSRCWAWLGLVAGLSIHAHPSAVFVLVLLPWVVWRRYPDASWRRECLSGIAGLGLGVLPMLPMLWMEATEGWPSAQRTVAYASEGGAPFTSIEVFRLLRGTFWFGPIDALSLWVEQPWLPWLLCLPLVLVLGGLIAVLRRRGAPHVEQTSWPAPIGLLTIIVIACLLVAARSYAPFYMVLVLLPLIAGCLACWVLALPRQGFVRLSLLLVAMAGQWVLIAAGANGLATINISRLSNVRALAPERSQVALLPALELDALRRIICDHDGSIVLHGYLAALFDGALMTDQDASCAASAKLHFSGAEQASAQHWLGLPPELAQQFDLQSSDRWRDTPHLGLQPLWPQKALTPADPMHYPHHQASGALLTEQIWRVRSQSANLLVTTDLLFPYRVNRVERVFANGKPASKLAELNITQIWSCEACTSGPIDWEIHGKSNDMQTLDIVAFPAPSSPGSAK